VLVINRFRVSESSAEAFRAEAEEALAAIREQKGYVDGVLGRNADDPELWVLQTRWTGAGAYRRALSAYDVKVRAWPLLGRAVDEPSAYEILEPGRTVNEARPRGNR
jgi:quinol monooxygenase YgiN